MIRLVSCFSTIKKEAEKIANFYNTTNVIEISKHLGINIFYSDLHLIDGFLQKYHHTYIIHVNSNIQSETTVNKVIAHELGHYFLHRFFNAFKMCQNTLSFTYKLEYEANLFASELLLTDKMLIDERCYIENMSSDSLATYFNVDTELVHLKMKSFEKHPLFLPQNRTYVLS